MRRFTLPVLFGLSVCLLVAGGLPRASAQADKDKQKSERVHFETVDQVELHGTFWPGGKGRKSPCVLLLHKLNGKGSHEEGWDLLADELAKKGFAVLSFDFRGHGDSNTIGTDFWKSARTPEDLGIAGMSKDALLEFLKTGQKSV